LVAEPLRSAPPPASDDTRTRILAVARRLIAERGFAATSTRELSERLGFTKAALYYHFRTKDDLLAALAGPPLTELHALVERAPNQPTAAARRRLLEQYLDIISAHRDLVQVISQDPTALQSPALASVPALYGELVRRLSGKANPSLADVTRSRAALACVDAGVCRAGFDDDMGVVRYATLTAACGALGIPGPRPPELRSPVS
jgi:AcrR family transcriptional regulator